MSDKTVERLNHDALWDRFVRMDEESHSCVAAFLFGYQLDATDTKVLAFIARSWDRALSHAEEVAQAKADAAEIQRFKAELAGTSEPVHAEPGSSSSAKP